MTTKNSNSSVFIENNLLHGYSKTHELKLITVSLASPERIKSWAEKVLPNGKIFGEITNANTLHYKTFKPQKGGLFCERIFGPLKDFECACGVKRRPSELESKQILEHKQTTHHFCPNCDVEYTWSVIRRYQLGYIRLNSPVCHLWYLKTNPSYLSILLDIRRRDLESIVYCTQTPTIEYFWKTSNVYFMENSPAQIYLNWKKSFETKPEIKVSLITFERQIEMEKEKRQQFQLTSFQNWKQSVTNSIDTLNSLNYPNLEDGPFDDKSKTLALAKKMRENIQKFQYNQMFSLLIRAIWKEFYRDLFINASKKSSKLLTTFLQNYEIETNVQTARLQNKHLKKNFSFPIQQNVYIKKLPNLLETWKLKLENEIEKSLNLFNISLEKNIYQDIEKTFKFSDSSLNGYEQFIVHLKTKMNKNDPFYEFPFLNKISTLLNNHYEMKLYLFIQDNKNSLSNEFSTFSTNSGATDHLPKFKSLSIYDTYFKVNKMLHLLKEAEFFWKKDDAFYLLFLEYLTIYLAKQQFKKILKKRRSLVFHSKNKEIFFINCFKEMQTKPNHLSFYNIVAGLEKTEKWSNISKTIQSVQKNKLTQLKTEKNTFFSNLDSMNPLFRHRSSVFKEIFKKRQQIDFNDFNVSVTNWKYSKMNPRNTDKMQFASQRRFEIANLRFVSTSATLLDRKKQIFQKRQKRQNGQISAFKQHAFKTNITNNIYTVGYNYMWSIERDWKYFLQFNTALVSFEDSKIAYYKNRTLNETQSSSKPSIIGAGMLQKLLLEYEPAQLKDMSKQHQILIPKLNHAVRSLRHNGSAKYNVLQIQKLLQKRDHIIRRLKLIRLLFRKNSSPNTMILSILPVLPPDLRPILKLQGQIAASDLNRLYQRIIYRNDRVQKFRKDPATSQSFEIKYAQRLLQEAVDNLIQNGKGNVKPETNSRGQPLKSLSEILKGKQGRFRQYLLGKRVDYSGRSVIVVGPKLKLYECGLPKEMALELFLPFLIKRILHYKLARTVIGAKRILKDNSSFTWNLLNEIMKNHPILLNRAPTLHRLGIQAFQPKLIEGRAILLHPLVCPAFNADFDGDQMAVHLPLTTEARTEAWKLMFSRNNLISPATGEPIVLPSQDMVLGCYYLTTEIPSQFLNSKTFLIQNPALFQNGVDNNQEKPYSGHNQHKNFPLYFTNFAQVITAYQSQRIAVQTPIWVKWNNWTEFGNDISQPLEIRVDSYGYWEDIRLKYHSRFDSNGLNSNTYIRTTAGRVLMHFMIQNCIKT